LRSPDKRKEEYGKSSHKYNRVNSGVSYIIIFFASSSKDIEDQTGKGHLSGYVYSSYCGYLCMWIVYGSLIEELPVILSNSIAAVLCSLIMAAKIVYGKKGSE